MADENESEVVQTCFALLFLKRSTSPPTVPITPAALTGGEAPPVDLRGPGTPRSTDGSPPMDGGSPMDGAK